MKSALSSPAATAQDAADSHAATREENGGATRRRLGWRRAAELLLTCGLCVGSGLLVKREHQRQAALSLLEDCGATCMAWHGPWGREHILDPHDWEELRSRTFLYPDVIITPELYSDAELTTHHAGNADDADREDDENEVLRLELHKGDALKLLAALEVLRPKMLIMRGVHTQGPAFWRRLSQVTSLEGLMVYSSSIGFDDRSLQEVSHLPRLSVLMLANAGVTSAGLTCLDTCPQLKTLSLQSTRIGPESALACMRRCPNLQIKLNGNGLSRR